VSPTDITLRNEIARPRCRPLNRIALVLTALALPALAGCGDAPGVPRWKDGVALPASPGVIGSGPALDHPSGGAAGSATTQPVAAPPAAQGPSSPAGPASYRETSRATSSPGSSSRSPERFAAAVAGRLPEVAVDRRPEEITEIGNAACAELTGGRRRGAAVDEVAEYGVSSSDAREVVRLARTFLCPA
jgi:hypothetical protein